MKTLINLITFFKSSDRFYKFKEGYHSVNRGRVSVIYRDKHGNPYKVNLLKMILVENMIKINPMYYL